MQFLLLAQGPEFDPRGVQDGDVTSRRQARMKKSPAMPGFFMAVPAGASHGREIFVPIARRSKARAPAPAGMGRSYGMTILSGNPEELLLLDAQASRDQCQDLTCRSIESCP